MKRIVADTEVFHETCVALIPQSLANRLKLKVIELNGKVRSMQAFEREAALLRTTVDDLSRQAREANERADRMRVQRDEAQTRSSTFRASNSYQQADLDRARQENERLSRELENTRNELRLHQTISGGGSTGSVTAIVKTPDAKPPEKPPSDMWSDMDERFRLLEIDDKK